MSNAQRYTDSTAIGRMREGLCPECGAKTEDHGGRGTARCSLTDNGVAARLDQFRRDGSERVSGRGER